MKIRGQEFTTVEVSGGMVQHLIEMGEEMFEKVRISDVTDEIDAAVFVIVGPNAGELTALVREWAVGKGFRSKSYERTDGRMT